MKEETIVRENLMTRKYYSPYCGSDNCGYRNPRATWKSRLNQFECICGWRSEFPEDFIQRYKLKWNM